MNFNKESKSENIIIIIIFLGDGGGGGAGGVSGRSYNQKKMIKWSLTELVRAISFTFMYGFQNKFAQLFI